jgi:GTP-binding protein LepA
VDIGRSAESPSRREPLKYKALDGQIYSELDRLGHVDFFVRSQPILYQHVVRRLAGGGRQGVERERFAIATLELGVEVVPVATKWIFAGWSDNAKQEIEEVMSVLIRSMPSLQCKTGSGIDLEILEAVVARIPPPKGDPWCRCLCAP